MTYRHTRRQGLPGLILVALLLAGCSSPTRKAPVEERSTAPKPAVAASAPQPEAATAAAAAASAPLLPPPLPGAENAGKPGYHTVKPGENLMRIALDYGQNWRDVARWNSMDNPNLVEVGQVLRVVPPPADPRLAAARAVSPTAASASTPPAGRPEPARPPAVGAAAPMAEAPASSADAEEIVWMWPAAGVVIAGFDEGRNKGLTIAGKAGDPVLAAGDGRVVYAGSSLRGYGNLVIVKHSDVFLTAYAHNQTLLVKDDQVVRRGQKIAEMGSSDAERVQLHFEIRRQGKPVDPAKLLPPR